MVKRIHGGTNGRALGSVRQVDEVSRDEHPQIHYVASRQSMLGTGLDRGGKPVARTVPIARTAPVPTRRKQRDQ